MEGFKNFFGGSTEKRSESTGGKKKSLYDAIADSSSRKEGDKATANQLKPPSKMSRSTKQKEASSYVDNTSVVRTSTSLEKGSYDTLKGNLEKHEQRKLKQEQWKLKQEQLKQQEREEREQNIAKFSSGANKYFSSLGEQSFSTGESSHNADVSERTIKHRELISSADQFREYLMSESSFIASQVSNVLDARKLDDTQKPLTRLLKECKGTLPTFQAEIDSHLETLKGFDQTTYPEKFKTAFATHIENVEKIKKRVNEKISTINKEVEAWQNYNGTLNSLKREIQRNWSRFNKTIDKLKESLKQLQEQLGKSDTYSYIEEPHSSDFDPSVSRYNSSNHYTNWEAESWESEASESWE